MWKKILLLLILIISSIGGYWLVFGSSLVFWVEISHVWELSNKIFLDDIKLSKTVVAYRSNVDISDYEIYSGCESNTFFLDKYKGVYFFEVDFFWNESCGNENIILSSSEGKVVHTMSQLTFIKENDKLAHFIDYSDTELRLYSWGLDIDMRKNAIFKNYDGRDIIKYYNYLSWQRRYLEAEYQKNIVSEIVQARKKKYLVPVAWKIIPDANSGIPNAPRNYRVSYTDGIHHGWDIEGALWEEVIALDDGIIVRVVSGFDQSDFDKIDYTPDSEYTKTRNLDVLRGNQVWLKTMKGEVVFYSHLEDVDFRIKEWMSVSRGDVLGTIGVTGVPGWIAYTHYHLHFPIMVNPYATEKAGTYDFWDYMIWDWKLKGLTPNEVRTQQKDIFE